MGWGNWFGASAQDWDQAWNINKRPKLANSCIGLTDMCVLTVCLFVQLFHELQYEWKLDACIPPSVQSPVLAPQGP